MTTANISYRTREIWSMDQNIFSDAGFKPADATDNPEPTKLSLNDKAILRGENMPPRQNPFED